ncbi:MAG: aminotransferase class I/II-fold pyridoxal phosphate-dependent enzyme, partial [Gemmatimonadaceae bacterium]|nr:aminotransferase class I/II-fold pyridoxal phosphate-dependent enzyme [Gemmatimonadaceae bacterium]
MFQTLSALPDDPILGLMAAYRMDSSPEKVDLGVGVYKDDRGRTVVLEAVRAAERWLLSEQESKAYLGPAGNEQFNEAIA